MDKQSYEYRLEKLTGAVANALEHMRDAEPQHRCKMCERWLDGGLMCWGYVREGESVDPEK